MLRITKEYAGALPRPLELAMTLLRWAMLAVHDSGFTYDVNGITTAVVARYVATGFGCALLASRKDAHGAIEALQLFIGTSPYTDNSHRSCREINQRMPCFGDVHLESRNQVCIIPLK